MALRAEFGRFWRFAHTVSEDAPWPGLSVTPAIPGLAHTLLAQRPMVGGPWRKPPLAVILLRFFRHLRSPEDWGKKKAAAAIEVALEAPITSLRLQLSPTAHIERQTYWLRIENKPLLFNYLSF